MRFPFITPKTKLKSPTPIAPVVFSTVWLDRTMDNVAGQLQWLIEERESIKQELENKRLARFSENLSVLRNFGNKPIMVNYDVHLLADPAVSAMVNSLTGNGRAFGIFMNPVIEHDEKQGMELARRGVSIGIRANNVVQSSLVTDDISFVHRHVIEPLSNKPQAQ